MPKIRTLIVDDEKPARRRLRELLEKQPVIDIIKECTNGQDAVEQIRATAPDLLFLDIQMPGLNGFGVVNQIGVDRMPVTIFVTAFDQYALKAFEVSALDYLLKPFSDERFEHSLERALDFINTRQRGELNDRMLALLDRMQPNQAANKTSYLERLAIKQSGQSGRVIFLRVEEIAWIEAAGVYVEIHAGKNSWLHRVSLSELETRLDPQLFLRIHRSTIVNLRHIKELQPHSHGDFLVVLQDGQQLKLSRNYRAKVESSLGQSL